MNNEDELIYSYEELQDLVIKYQNISNNLQKENKQLKVELQEANDNIIWWTNRFRAVERDNKQLKKDKKKAIEYINTHYLNANEPKLLEILGDKEK